MDTNTIAAALEEYTHTLPVGQLLSELQLVIERVTFSGIAASRESHETIMAEIEVLFSEDVSSGVLKFILWLQQKKLLSLLSGNNGSLFLNFCIKRYRNKQQVVFTTAVAISFDLQEYIYAALRSVKTADARIAFKVDPHLIAGFTIDDGGGLVDRSLRELAEVMIPKKVQSAASGAPRV